MLLAACHGTDDISIFLPSKEVTDFKVESARVVLHSIEMEDLF